MSNTWGQVPSDYFATLRETLDEQELVEILRSQLIDADDQDDPMRRDDYLGFIDRRLEDVVTAIESVTLHPVIREEMTAEAP